MQIVNVQQGTPEWFEHRAQSLNASDAPAMMGVSPYKTRSQLIKEMATGITPEVPFVWVGARVASASAVWPAVRAGPLRAPATGSTR